MAKRKRKQQNSYEEALAPPRKKQYVPENLPEGVHHYQRLSEVPRDLQKYWHQGYSIFSKYDDGIWMTDDAWYGVTHEDIAQFVRHPRENPFTNEFRKIAQDIAAAAPADKSIIIDPFCGVGGNTIAFALSGRWKRVYAIEKDKATLECAKNNARVYGVADQITWFCGDCFEILGLDDETTANAVWELQLIIRMHGVIFASPPWGGPGYKNDIVFNLETMQPYGLSRIYDRFAKVTPNMALYLPRTSDLSQIAAKVPEGKKSQVVHYCQNGRSKALSVYLGSWKTIHEQG